MKAALCIDDMGGILFNNRRVSSDGAIFADLKALSNGKLFITPFSAELMQRYGVDCVVDTDIDIFEKGNHNDIFFAENVKLSPHFDRISEIIVYRFNRRYPSDFKTDIDFSDLILTDSADFKGTSHDKITREIYQNPNCIG